ncbi:antigen [Sarotherodon galilaeus]
MADDDILFEDVYELCEVIGNCPYTHYLATRLCFDLVALVNLLQRLKGRAHTIHESCSLHIWRALVTEGLIQTTWE